MQSTCSGFKENVAPVAALTTRARASKMLFTNSRSSCWTCPAVIVLTGLWKLNPDQAHARAGTYSDLAGNTGTGDLNATVPVSDITVASTLSSSTASSSRGRGRLSAGAIAGAVIGGIALAVLLCCCAAWVS